MKRLAFSIMLGIVAVVVLDNGADAVINISLSQNNWDIGSGGSGEYTSPQFSVTNAGEPVRLNIRASNTENWYISNMPRLNAFALKWTSGGTSGSVAEKDTTMLSRIGLGETKDFSLTYYAPTYNMSAADKQTSKVVLTAVSSYIGRTWDIKSSTMPTLGREADITLDASGEPHLFYYNDGFWYSDWNSLPVAISTNSSGSLFSKADLITFDKAGWPHMLFYEPVFGEGNSARLMYAWFDGHAWQHSYVGQYRGMSSDPVFALAVDPNLAGHAIYKNGDGQLSYLKFNSLGEILEEKIIAETYRFTDGAVYLKLDSNNRPCIIYSNYLEDIGDNEFFYVRKTESGEWVATKIGTGQPLTGLAIDANDNAYAATSLLESGVNGGYVLRFNAEGGWSKVAALTALESLVGGDAGIMVDANGYPYLAYPEPTENGVILRFSQWSGTEWISQDVLSENTPDLEVKIGFDLNYNPVIAAIPKVFNMQSEGAFNYAVLK